MNIYCANNPDLKRTLTIVCLAALAVACQSNSVSTVTPSPTVNTPTLRSPLLVFTKWVPDPNVSNGPQPGFKPAFTGLTAHDIQTANAVINTTGTDWIVDVSFTSRGAELFKQLTRDSVAACPDGSTSAGSDKCAQRHLGIWLDLTQADIDNWADPAYAAKISQPFDLDCLTRLPAASACAKLVTDPVVLQEIDGGQLAIADGSNEQRAKGLAEAITALPRS